MPIINAAQTKRGNIFLIELNFFENNILIYAIAGGSRQIFKGERLLLVERKRGE